MQAEAPDRGIAVYLYDALLVDVQKGELNDVL
jgi:hypothetical protein